MRRSTPMALCAALMMLSACAGPPGAGPGGAPSASGAPSAAPEPAPAVTELPLPDRTATPPPAPAPTPGPTAPPTAGPVGGQVVPGSEVEAAVLDLAAHLGVPREAVSVVAADQVTWPDGALGCPQPGSMYTQAQVDGMRIELSAGGTTYRYHSGGGRPPFRCEHAHPRALDR